MDEKITEQELATLSDGRGNKGLRLRVVAAYRAQAEEITLLSRLCDEYYTEIALLKMQLHGTSQDADHYKEECGRLKTRDQKLVEDNPFPRGATGSEDIPKYEIIDPPAENSLKVDFTDYIAQSALGEMVLSLGEKHSALVDKCYELTHALAEVTQSRFTIALLEAQVTSLAEKVGDLAMERAEMKVEIKRLREENANLAAWKSKAINLFPSLLEAP